jgi:hypothetical protein
MASLFESARSLSIVPRESSPLLCSRARAAELRWIEIAEPELGPAGFRGAIGQLHVD